MRADAVLVDTGPLVALLSASDKHHASCARTLKDLRAPLYTIWPVVSEATYLLGTISQSAQDHLLAIFAAGDIQLLPLDIDDFPRMRELMSKYADLPMDLADAALVRAAEREGIVAVLTTDRRDFSIYRPRHARAFKILP